MRRIVLAGFALGGQSRSSTGGFLRFLVREPLGGQRGPFEGMSDDEVIEEGTACVNNGAKGPWRTNSSSRSCTLVD